MNLRELKDLISDNESERLEFKRSTGQRTEAAKTVCAMLNGLGGFVLFGVTNQGELIGQQVGTKTLEDITSELRRIEPPAFPDIETINLKKGAAVVLLTVSRRWRALYLRWPCLSPSWFDHYPHASRRIRTPTCGTTPRHPALGE